MGEGAGGKSIIRTAAVYSVFACLYSILCKYVGTRHVVTSVHAFGDHAESTGLQRFLPLCTTLCKDVEPNACHKRIKPWPASAGSVKPDKFSARKRCRRLGSSTVNIQQYRMFQVC